jgi:hypothetical protein
MESPLLSSRVAAARSAPQSCRGCATPEKHIICDAFGIPRSIWIVITYGQQAQLVFAGLGSSNRPPNPPMHLHPCTKA